MMTPTGPLIATMKIEPMLAALRELVESESPSHDKPALDLLSKRIARRFADLGLDQEWIVNPSGGDHLLMKSNNCNDSSLRPALILCHFDTVWPIGTLATMPFRIEGNRAFGPGVYDMKASLVLIEFALRAIRDRQLIAHRPIHLLFTSDEEIGSMTSRALIEAQARGANHVLVMEPPLDHYRLKTARKGVGRFVLEVEGRAAHAGVEPEKGVNAIVELARQVLEIDRLANHEAGTTINIGLIQGGTTTNVVPATASASIDVRVKALDEARRVEQALHGLQPFHPNATLKWTGGFNRPPMERSPQGMALFQRVAEVGRSIGLEFKEGSTGGGSDGNFTAALGIPTVDGLGMPGEGAHASHEQIFLDYLQERAELLALLLLEL